MSDNSQYLLNLKKRIEEAKRKESELGGVRKRLKQELKDKFGISSKKEAEDKCAELTSKVGESKKSLEENYEKLREMVG